MAGFYLLQFKVHFRKCPPVVGSRSQDPKKPRLLDIRHNTEKLSPGDWWKVNYQKLFFHPAARAWGIWRIIGKHPKFAIPMIIIDYYISRAFFKTF